MRILAENAQRDLFKGPNNQLLVRVDLEATLQACASAVEAQRGEMQYDTTRGLPTSSTIWAGVPNQQRFRFYAVEAIRAVEGVTGVKRFDTDIFEGVLEYEAEIRTEFGVQTITGNIFSGL